jgi:hypothetical protein
LDLLGHLSYGEKWVMGIFSLAILLWMGRSFINQWMGDELLDDAMIALFAGVLPFFIPHRFRGCIAYYAMGGYPTPAMEYPFAIWRRALSGLGYGADRAGDRGSRTTGTYVWQQPYAFSLDIAPGHAPVDGIDGKCGFGYSFFCRWHFR